MHGQDCVDFVSIEDRAKLLLTDLQSLDLSKPMIMIGHSMGGLIMKSMFIQSDQQFRDNIKGMVFYSTPHFGSKEMVILFTYMFNVLTLIRLSIQNSL